MTYSVSSVAERQWVAAVPVSDVPPGAMLAIEIGELRIAIYNVDGSFYATSNICTHQFALLTDGWLDGPIVECPLHGGQFNVTSGTAMGGIVDCDLVTYPVREADGWLEVSI